MSGRGAKVDFKCPIAMKWSLFQDFLEDNMHAPGECLISEAFKAPNNSDIEYYLEIYPNGDTEEHRGETWIFLCLVVRNGSKVEATFNISIKSANYTSILNHVFEESGSHGAKICSTEELFDPEKRYIIDGKFVVTMDGFLMFSTFITKKNETISDFNSHVHSLCLGLWQQDNTKDFKIVVDEKEIKVHKCVLAAQSSVFTKMFESGMKEAQEGKVEIKDFSFEIVEMAIKLCYHRSLVLGTSLEDKMTIIKFFDKYDIQPLKDLLETFLIYKMDESNVCLLANCSLLSNAKNLEEKCFEFLMNCAKFNNPISDYELLDKDFALNLLNNLFYPVSQ